MIKKTILFTISLFFIAVSFGQASYKYGGDILSGKNSNTKFPVVLSFKSKMMKVGIQFDGGCSFEGTVLYTKKNKTFILKGKTILQNGNGEFEFPNVVINEYYAKQFVGKYHLTFSEDFSELNGYWYSPDESKMLPVHLKLLSRAGNDILLIE